MMADMMSSLRDRYTGRPAAVLGGGPSLPADMARLPEGSLRIAVNYHYQALTGEDPDFMVFNDHMEPFPALAQAVRKTNAIKVTPDAENSDIIFDVDVWTGFYSSNTATWLALWMGCDPVILCGMDCYQGDQLYCHPSDGYDCAAFHKPLAEILRPWIEDGKNLLPHQERLKVMSGPLVGVFGGYEA